MPESASPAVLSIPEVNSLKQAPPVEGVLPAILQRWSPISFSDREVAPGDVARLFEAARWSPSSGNSQPWRFLVGLRNSETHKKIAATLGGANQIWAPHAPVLILGTALAVSPRTGAPNYYALYDLGQATALLVLQAAAQGLAAHQMGGYDKEAIRAAFEIPAEYALGSVIAVGYQGEPSALTDEKLLAREQTPRTRKPLQEMAFSSWETPASLA